MSADPPLLATDQHSETPNLGPAASDLEPSPLERLIQQSTSEQQQLSEDSSSPQFFLEQGPTSFSIAPPPPLSLPQTSASMYLTLGTASLCFLHAGLVWASFLSSAWFETYLRFTVDWQDENVMFSQTKYQLLRTSTLSSLLSGFLDADLNGAAVALLLTSLILPCISIILTSGWTISDHKERAILRGNTSTTASSLPIVRARICFEWMLRLSFAVVFSLSILDVATGSIDLIGNGSDLRIVNRTSNGLVCYTTGMFLSLIVIGVLRWGRTKTSLSASITSNNSSNDRIESNARSSTMHAPPSHAFQLPWTRSMDSEAASTMADQVEPLLPRDEPDTPQLIRQAPNAFASLPLWKQIVLYEAALGATVLLIPALFLPLFTLDFGGLASEFIEETTITFYFWKFPILLHSAGYLAETKHWMVLTQGSIFLNLVYIIPLKATVLAIGTWRFGPKMSKHCYRILYILQPCLCSLIFCLSVVVVVNAFHPLAERLLSNKTAGICDKFHLITDDTCLTIDGEPQIGAWFLLAQSLSLEILVVLTMIWRS